MPTHPRIAFPGLRAAAAALAAALSACALEPPPPASALPQPTLTPVAFHHSVSFAVHHVLIVAEADVAELELAADARHKPGRSRLS